VKSFDDLFAEPLRLYDYAVSFGAAVRRYCSPLGWTVSMTTVPSGLLPGVNGRSAGCDRSARIWSKPLRETSHWRPRWRTCIPPPEERTSTSPSMPGDFPIFGKTWSRRRRRSRRKRFRLAALIENLRDACLWRETALRNVPDKVKDDIFFIRDLAETQDDGKVYYPQIDDAAKAMDWESLCYAGLKPPPPRRRAARRWPNIRGVSGRPNLDIPTRTAGSSSTEPARTRPMATIVC